MPIYLTVPHSAGHAMGSRQEGPLGTETSVPCTPAPGAVERAGRGGRTASSLGKRPVSTRVIPQSPGGDRSASRVCGTCSGARDRPPARYPSLSPAWHAPPRKHGDPVPATSRARPAAAPSALAHVCVRACPLLCRETVTVTQSKQVEGPRGHSYATFSVS